MKIIAKTKDFYDYLQGEFGVDPNRVYDRRHGEHIGLMVESRIQFIHLNNKTYPSVFYNGRCRYDAESFSSAYTRAKEKGSLWAAEYHFLMGPWFSKKSVFEKITNTLNDFPKETNINSVLREPVVISNRLSPKPHECLIPALLSEFNFASRLTPKEVYLEIDHFLGWLKDNPPIPDRQTDRDKIISHGFDLKTSFRHRK